jgi:YHS domain-containing protein
MGMAMLTRREMALGGLIVGAGAGMSAPSRAAPGVFTKDGFAIAGYDSVSYFTAKKAAMGQAAYNVEWKGANWLFNSQANRDAFVSAPDKYAPGFNGYCPFCLAGGKLVPGVGNWWDVNKGKLYLLLSARVKDDFIMKADHYIERASAYWAKLS